MSKTGNRLVRGAAVLGIAGLIIKGLGAIFRIPLTNWIGDTGMAYYGVAYTIYGALLVLSTAGVPVAISRLVSENIATGRYLNAHKVFKISLKLLIVIGLVSFALCFYLGDAIASLVGNVNAALPLKAISPALLIVPILSAFRGYFQGRQNMMPTAISEITEQVVRVAVGLLLAFILLSRGVDYSAAGAAFGASAGAASGLVIIVMLYLLKRRKIHTKIKKNSLNVDSWKTIVYKIVSISVPIIIGSEIMPIMNVIDTGVIMNRLQATGWSAEASTSMYGILSGFCNSLITFPQVFTQGVAVCLVPAIAASFKVCNKKFLQENVTLGYRISMIMAFPCAFGITALAEPILLMLYPNQRASASAASLTLIIMSFSIILLAVSQTSTGVLQSIGKQMLPVKHLALGCIAKFIATYVLVGIPSININGAAVGTLIAYMISLMLNNRSVEKHTSVDIDYILVFIKPALAAGFMAIGVHFIYSFFMLFCGNSLSVIFSITFGCIIYILLIYKFKVVTIDEIRMLPFGRKITCKLERE